MTTAIGRLEHVQRSCPDGFQVLVTTVRAVEELHLGDVVIGYRADNGRRGLFRARGGVIVARQVKRDVRR